MIEIKFKADGSKEKTVAIIDNTIASRMQDVASLICENDILRGSSIYGIKETDIADIKYADDKLSNGNERAFYKATIKYVSCDDKLVKYCFLIEAHDFDEAKRYAEQMIEEEGLQLAELHELKKSVYNAVIDEGWIAMQNDIACARLDGYTDEEIEKSMAEGRRIFLETEESVVMHNSHTSTAGLAVPRWVHNDDGGGCFCVGGTWYCAKCGCEVQTTDIH